MMWQYHYTPYIRSMLASAAFTGTLAVYGWRHCATPGAVPFTALMLIVAIWAIGGACEVAAVDLSTKIFWFIFQDATGIPGCIAALCFALEYAGAQPESVISLLAELPGLLLIGVDLADHRALVLSGEQPRLLTADDLAQLIEAQSGGVRDGGR